MTPTREVGQNGMNKSKNWRVTHDGYRIWSEYDDAIVAFTATNVKSRTPKARADAELIAHAVNCHADLVSAVRMAIEYMAHPSSNPDIYHATMMSQLRAALTKAVVRDGD